MSEWVWGGMSEGGRGEAEGVQATVRAGAHLNEGAAAVGLGMVDLRFES